MKVVKTADGFELIPHTKDELERLRWLIECLQAHPSQRITTVSSKPFDAEKLFSDGEILVLDVIHRNSTEIRRALGL